LPAPDLWFKAGTTKSCSVGGVMAEHGAVEYLTATGNDYDAHRRTYRGFIVLAKWGTAAVLAVVALMAIFLL
jgi:hypothetical protein